MRRLACLVRLLLVVGVAFGALPVGSALADTTIGQVGGDRTALIGGCLGPVVLADTNYVVPSGGGQINSFSFQPDDQGANDGQQADFLVLRPTKGGAYMVIGQTGLVTLVAPPGTFEANTFPVTPAISVQGGDILGLWFPNGFNNCAREITGTGGGLIGTAFGLSDPKVNEVLALPNAVFINDVNESANLVTPSKDQCRNGGWRNFGQFKNHGDCTSFVATGGKNPPAGS